MLLLKHKKVTLPWRLHEVDFNVEHTVDQASFVGQSLS